VLLLADDVYTTGATIGECSRTLLDAGAKEVRAVTIARA
jgi:predicted amidophosphoribosyltransferase